MIQIMVRNFRGFNDIISTCPYCGSQQAFDVSSVCFECYEPMPVAEGLLTDIKDRVGFFKGLPPWDY